MMGEQRYNQSDNTWIYVVVAVSFVFILTIGSVLIYLGVKGDWFTEDTDDIMYEEIILKAVDNSTGAVIENTSYQLKQDALVIQEGQFSATTLEKFSTAVNGTNYTLTSWGTDYYANDKLCTINDEKCIISLQYIGHSYSMNVIPVADNLYRIIVYVPRGILQSPLLCLSWNDVYSMSITGMPLTAIPLEYQEEFDKCYQALEDFDSSVYYEFELTLDPQEVIVGTGEIPSFTVFIDDSCDNLDNSCAGSITQSIIV